MKILLLHPAIHLTDTSSGSLFEQKDRTHTNTHTHTGSKINFLLDYSESVINIDLSDIKLYFAFNLLGKISFLSNDKQMILFYFGFTFSSFGDN